MENNLYQNMEKLVVLSFISSISVGLALFFYAVFNDYIYYTLNEAVILLIEQGLLDVSVDEMMVTIQQDVLLLIPGAVDLLWAGAFVLFCAGFLQASYFVKREGYYSVLSFMTFGIMILLFVMSIFVTLAEWFNLEFIAKALPTLSYTTPFFSFYLNNIGLVNTGLIVLAVIINFVDLDFIKFNTRKKKESFDELA